MKNVKLFITRIMVNTTKELQYQQNYGTDISLSELRTGDLLLWGRPATHVAFYIDGAYILNAPYTSYVVRIQYININYAKIIIN